MVVTLPGRGLKPLVMNIYKGKKERTSERKREGEEEDLQEEEKHA